MKCNIVNLALEYVFDRHLGDMANRESKRCIQLIGKHTANIKFMVLFDSCKIDTKNINRSCALQ